MPSGFSIGDRVKSREGLCILQGSKKLEDGKFLFKIKTLDGGKAISIVSPPDILQKLPVKDLRFDPRGFSPITQWWNSHDALEMGTVKEIGNLYGALFGRVELEAYQLAPSLRILSKPRPRLLIADDVGIGKTIEAGLCILELLSRNRAKRILIISPPGLLDQWKDELYDKFNLQFEMIENASGLSRVQTSLPAGVNPWQNLPRILTSVEYIKKRNILDQVFQRPWDLIIVDEAHYLSESGTPQNPYRTKRTNLGIEIARKSRGLLLLTATPHNGYQNSFRSLIEYIEPTAATLVGDIERRTERIERARIRRLKSQIKKKDKDGNLVDAFHKREVTGIPVNLDPETELPFYREVSSYCSKVTKSALDSDDQHLISFAMQIVKKRMLSSRAALERTLENRLKALSKVEEREEKPEKTEIRDIQADLPMSEVTAERIAQRLIRSSVPEDEKSRKSEARIVRRIRKKLKSLPEQDPKIKALLDELHWVLDDDETEKVIVFTEYIDTLEAIKAALEGDDKFRGTWSVLRGGMTLKRRKRVQEDFALPTKRILLATDAASEGLNLQHHCRRIIHFELPWNPNRLEQRNGRVDRYGQDRQPIIKYLYFPDTPEDNVLNRLAGKIETMQSDRISTPDILGIAIGSGIEDRLTALDGETADPEKEADNYEHVFEDRTAEYINNVQPLLVSGVDVTKEIEDLQKFLEMSEPLIGDDANLESHLQAILGDSMMPVNDEGVYTIQVPRRFRGPNVDRFYPKVTCRRSVAIKTKPADVEFITPIHPLVKAISAEARQRLVQVYSDDIEYAPRRLAARESDKVKSPRVLFTFISRILAEGYEGNPELIEERIEPVSIDIEENMLSPEADNDLFTDRSNPGEADLANIRELFETSFVALLDKAKDEAISRLDNRRDELIEIRKQKAKALLDDLETFEEDRLKEIDEDEKLAAAKFREEQALFVFEEKRRKLDFDARREAVKMEIGQRKDELESFVKIFDPDPPQAISALFILPVGGGK